MKSTYTDTFKDVVQVDGSTIRTHTIDVPDATVIAENESDFVNFAATDPVKRAAAASASLNAGFPAYMSAIDAHHTTPRYVKPGDPPVVDNREGVISIRADGAVFRNGIRLGVVMTQLALVYGDGLYMKGKTDAKWWSWTGLAWSSLAGLTTELDSAIFV